MYVLGYECVTAAGKGAQALFAALERGQISTQRVQGTEWPQKVSAGGRVGFIESTGAHSFEKKLSDSLQSCWMRIVQHGDLPDLGAARVGFILASTKGVVEDFIWQCTPETVREERDPYWSLVENFLQENFAGGIELKTCVVSNACASSHVALELAQEWLASDEVDYAIVAAGDLVGAFVYEGFHSLKILSPTRNRPFAQDRDGLQLGEAVAVVVLGQKPGSSAIKIQAVASYTEGSSVTRPSIDGEALLRAIQKIHLAQPLNPDFIVAHGTGTTFNDKAEEQALSEFFARTDRQPVAPVTCTKWCVGHTLGASGLVDLVAACEILKRQRLFKIAATAKADETFKLNYVTATALVTSSRAFGEGLITSLGFGGVHAALSIKLEALREN